MTQAERDRLVTLRKTQKGLITRARAAEEMGLGVRQVKRLVKELERRGDKVAIHGLRGRPSNHRITSEYWRTAGQGPPFYRQHRGVRYLLSEVLAWGASSRVNPQHTGRRSAA